MQIIHREEEVASLILEHLGDDETNIVVIIDH